MYFSTIQELFVNFAHEKVSKIKNLFIIQSFIFKGYPCGTITLEQFQQIYAQFFPFGNSRKYAEYVFRTFDRDDNGKINFEVSLKDKVFNTNSFFFLLMYLFIGYIYQY